MITIKYKGNDCYIVDAELVKDGRRTMRVKFNGKIYFWPKIHAEEAKSYGKNKFAIRCSFYNVLYDQNKTRRVINEKIKLRNNPIRRISSN